MYIFILRAVVTYWWEHSPHTSVAWVRFPDLLHTVLVKGKLTIWTGNSNLDFPWFKELCIKFRELNFENWALRDCQHTLDWYCMWVCWFFTLLWEVFSWVLRFYPLLNNFHLIWFQFTVSSVSASGLEDSTFRQNFLFSPPWAK